MKKLTSIAAAVLVAGGVTVAAAVPAQAAPPVTAIGKKCDTYHKETHWFYGYGTAYTYRIAPGGDQYARCVYRVNKFRWIALEVLSDTNYMYVQHKRPSGGR